MQLILERCQHTEVSIQQCEASLLGYVVQFALQNTSSILLGSSFLYMAQCALACMVMHACGLLDAFFESSA